ncbi:MAG: bifunctional diaminohydroxyphosphoribosylaminopyrimidine deaminase/5-amino-6-(5-phosphoribosylamino)uracil reductase RibD [Elusimicrobia bacterium]|nr:bifunctional diaminohydroxyphosphoribosylaminopyrimidine deaminase/5-amino-6-(5-phosphoribosylamino)uracil reductase RibD [Elusimicrobiota bacterium]
MKEALSLARRGEGGTRPNPPVGAVIVSKGRAVGRGWHRKAGGPHAEVFALRQAGPMAKGATAYVTLEPCSTWGLTGPCTERLIAAGVRRVVFGVRDPNPKHQGAGATVLRKAGIKVAEGVEKEAAGALIRPFSKRMRTGLPYLTLKMAMSLDGRIAEPGGLSRWVSGPGSRAVVMELRRRVDAVMVGSRTVLKDDPRLLPEAGQNTPFRVIVDSRGRTPVSARVLTDGNQAATIIATTSACLEGRRRSYLRSGASVWSLPKESGKVSLKALMKKLGEEGILHVLCEGGGELAASVIKAGLADEYLFFVAPKFLGSRSLPVVGGKGAWPLESAPGLRFESVAMAGSDVMLRAFPLPF